MCTEVSDAKLDIQSNEVNVLLPTLEKESHQSRFQCYRGTAGVCLSPSSKFPSVFPLQ